MARTLWTAGEIAAATAGRAGGDWRATGVSIDSRTLRAGDLFFAVQGPNFDGHEYVAAAFEAGAAGAIIAQDSEAAVVAREDGFGAHGPLVVVDDVLAALEGLGRAGRARIGKAVIAVTGSVGKTGTKESLRAVLGAQAPTQASEKSYNNKWGVPLSLSRTPRDTAYGVFEIGMNKAGEIAGLSPQVRPNVAIITHIASAHLEFFDSVEAIADAKAEVFIGLEAGGTAIVNRDDDHFERLAAAAAKRGAGRVIGFGRHGDADARLLDQALHAHCSCVSAEICGQAITYKIGTPGEHWVTNSLAVLAAVSAVDADLGLAGLALAGLSAPQGRGNRRKLDMRDGSFELIDESYNGNPASMLAAIEVLALSSVGNGGRRIAVLGDMAELGQEAPRLHGELADTLCDTGIDKVFTVGRLMSYLDRALPVDIRGQHAETPEELVDTVRRELRPGDVVMVKGSLSTRMVVVVEALQRMVQPPLSLAATG